MAIADEWWARDFACSSDELRPTRTRVQRHAGTMVNNPGIWILVAGGAPLVSLPSDTTEALGDLASAWSAADVADVATLQQQLAPVCPRTVGKIMESSHEGGSAEAHAEWKSKLASSEVRLQWDPDHDPAGGKLLRRAVQLGLRGDTLRAFATQELKQVIDMTPLIVQQRPHAAQANWTRLQTPIENVYQPDDPSIKSEIRLDVD